MKKTILNSNYLILFSLLWTVFLSNPEERQSGDEIQEFTLEKQEEIILESEDMLFGRFRQGFVVSKDERLLAFHDFSNQQIVVFNSDGSFVNAIGSEGSGPEEFRNVFGYNFSKENTIWAFDENLNTFKHFDLDGNIISTIEGIYGDGFVQTRYQLFVNNETLYIPVKEAEYSSEDASQNWQSALMAVYSTAGEFVKTIGTYGDPVKNPNHYAVRGLFDIDFEEETLLVGYSTSHQLSQIKLDTDNQEFFGKIPENFLVPTESTNVDDSLNEILRKGLSRSSPSSVFITDHYYVQYFQNLTQEWYDTRDPNTKDHFLVFYDRKSQNYLGELEIPFAVGAITPNGTLYLIEDIDPDAYTIGSYRLHR